MLNPATGPPARWVADQADGSNTITSNQTQTNSNRYELAATTQRRVGCIAGSNHLQPQVHLHSNADAWYLATGDQTLRSFNPTSGATTQILQLNGLDPNRPLAIVGETIYQFVIPGIHQTLRNNHGQQWSLPHQAQWLLPLHDAVMIKDHQGLRVLSPKKRTCYQVITDNGTAGTTAIATLHASAQAVCTLIMSFSSKHPVSC